jgi:exocyst complex component 4
MVLAMHGICRTLHTMPVHSDELIKFLDSLLRRYYEKTLARFRSLLVSDDATELDEEQEKENSVLSVTWAIDPDITSNLRRNTYLRNSNVLFI